MKPSESLRDFRQLTVEESRRTYGGNTQQNLIFFPIAIGNCLGTRIAPDLVELFLKYSMFLPV